MPHQDVTKTVAIEIRYFMGNNNAQNTLHALCSTTPGLADLDLLGALVVAWLNTEWAPIVSSDWTANQVVLTSLDSLDGPRTAVPISPPTPGELLVGAEPANVTWAVKADIGRRGRGTAGRVFWVGFTQTQVDQNIVAAGDASNIVAALETLRTNVEGLANFEGLCVPHMTVDGLQPNPASSSLIQRFTATDNSVDSQKNRLPFHKKKKRNTLPVIP